MFTLIEHLPPIPPEIARLLMLMLLAATIIFGFAVNSICFLGSLATGGWLIWDVVDISMNIDL